MAQWLSVLAALEGDQDLIFQHPHGGSESATPVPETLAISLAFQAPGIHAVHIHTCRQSTVSRTESNFLK